VKLRRNEWSSGARQAGIANLAPHDLRRTCARLCHDCCGELEQIRFLLGHASIQTTERYIGSKQKLQDAVNDRFAISVASETAEDHNLHTWRLLGVTQRIALCYLAAAILVLWSGWRGQLIAMTECAAALPSGRTQPSLDTIR
jgi:hypothetical protein